MSDVCSYELGLREEHVVHDVPDLDGMCGGLAGGGVGGQGGEEEGGRAEC